MGWEMRDCSRQQGTQRWKMSKLPSASQKQADFPCSYSLYFSNHLTYILGLVSPLHPADVFLTFIMECSGIN